MLRIVTGMRRWAAIAMVAIAASVTFFYEVGGFASAGARAPSADAVVHRGVTAGKAWVVFVASESIERRRQGICLATAIVYPESGYLCARPRKRRGMVTVSPFGRGAHGEARMTVIAGAFNPAVRTLRLTLANGRVMRLRPRPIHSRQAQPRIKAYRYVATAVKGSICAQRLETFGAGRRVLWDAPRSELRALGLLCGSGA